MKGKSHFYERCLERNVFHDPNLLAKEITEAIRYGLEDFVEKVVQTANDTFVYRFRVPNGIFYVVAKKKYPITVLAGGSYVNVRRKGKLKKKWLN